MAVFILFPTLYLLSTTDNICTFSPFLPLVQLIHCCPFFPVICCTSVMRACLGSREAGVRMKGVELSEL